jgi:hypothetical protein
MAPIRLALQQFSLLELQEQLHTLLRMNRGLGHVGLSLNLCSTRGQAAISFYFAATATSGCFSGHIHVRLDPVEVPLIYHHLLLRTKWQLGGRHRLRSGCLWLRVRRLGVIELAQLRQEVRAIQN